MPALTALLLKKHAADAATRESFFARVIHGFFARFNAGFERLANLYASRGHPYVEIQPPGQSVREDGSIDLHIQIDEGPEVRFGYALEESPQPDTTVGAFLPDAERSTVSARCRMKEPRPLTGIEATRSLRSCIGSRLG